MKNSTHDYPTMISRAKMLSIVFILAAATSSNAQALKGSTYIEKTISSPKVGHSIGVVFPGYLGDMEVGGFYQQAVMYKQESTSNKKIEEKFFGLYMNIAFFQIEKVVMNFNMRAGSVNDQSFVITPALISDVMLFRSLGISLGIGMRNSRPTYIGGLILKLNDVGHTFTKSNSYNQKNTYKYR